MEKKTGGGQILKNLKINAKIEFAQTATLIFGFSTT